MQCSDEKKVMYIYGRLRHIKWAKAYCKLHKCYLEGNDISEKKCNKKHCKHLEEIE